MSYLSPGSSGIGAQGDIWGWKAEMCWEQDYRGQMVCCITQRAVEARGQNGEGGRREWEPGKALHCGAAPGCRVQERDGAGGGVGQRTVETLRAKTAI